MHLFFCSHALLLLLLFFSYVYCIIFFSSAFSCFFQNYENINDGNDINNNNSDDNNDDYNRFVTLSAAELLYKQLVWDSPTAAAAATVDRVLLYDSFSMSINSHYRRRFSVMTFLLLIYFV